MGRRDCLTISCHTANSLAISDPSDIGFRADLPLQAFRADILPVPAVPDDHFARAAGEKAAQNPAQAVHAESRTDSHEKKETAAPLAFAGGAAVLFQTQVPPRGTERPQDSGRETQNPPAPGTESGTPAGDRLIDLLAIVATLPPRSIAVLADLARLLAARQEKDSPGTRTP